MWNGKKVKDKIKNLTLIQGVRVSKIPSFVLPISDNLHIRRKVVISSSKAPNKLTDYLKKLTILDMQEEVKVEVCKMKGIWPQFIDLE